MTIAPKTPSYYVGYSIRGDDGVPVSVSADEGTALTTAIWRVLSLGDTDAYVAVRGVDLTDDQAEQLSGVLARCFADLGVTDLPRPGAGGQQEAAR